MDIHLAISTYIYIRKRPRFRKITHIDFSDIKCVFFSGIDCQSFNQLSFTCSTNTCLFNLIFITSKIGSILLLLLLIYMFSEVLILVNSLRIIVFIYLTHWVDYSGNVSTSPSTGLHFE